MINTSFNLTSIKKNSYKYIKFVFPIILFFVVLHVAKKELYQLDYRLAFTYIKTLSVFKIFIISIVAFISVAALILYDTTLKIFLRLEIPFLKLLKLSWIANSFNNLFGMGGLTGAGIRTYLYKDNNVPSDVSLYSSFLITLATGTGLSFLSLLGLLGYLPMKDLYQDHYALTLILIGATLYLFIYFAIFINNSYGKKIIFFNKRRWILFSISLFTASLFEWLFAAILFYLISYMVGIQLSFLFFLGLFTIAAVAGIISMVPGGLGSFDLTIMLGLEFLGIDPELGLASLIIYRLLYYLLPWIIGLFFASQMILPKCKQLVNGSFSKSKEIFNNYSIDRYSVNHNRSISFLFFIVLFSLLIVTPFGILKSLFLREAIFAYSIVLFVERG